MLAEARDVESPTEGAPKKTSHLRVRTDLHEEYSPEEIAKMTELYEGTLSNIEEGEIVKSKVLRVTDTAVILDVGFKSEGAEQDRKSTRLNSSHSSISYAVFCLKKKKIKKKKISDRIKEHTYRLKPES